MRRIEKLAKELRTWERKHAAATVAMQMQMEKLNRKREAMDGMDDPLDKAEAVAELQAMEADVEVLERSQVTAADAVNSVMADLEARKEQLALHWKSKRASSAPKQRQRRGSKVSEGSKVC